MDLERLEIDTAFPNANPTPKPNPYTPRLCPCWHSPTNRNMECYCLCCVAPQPARNKPYPCGDDGVPCECMYTNKPLPNPPTT